MYHSRDTHHCTNDCPSTWRQRRTWIKVIQSILHFAAVRTQRSQPHNALEPPSPAIQSILPFIFSTSLPNQSGSTSGILSVILLCYNKPPIASTSSTDNIPNTSSVDNISPNSPTNNLPSAKQASGQNEANPPPPPPPQVPEPQQQNEAFPTHGTILAITGGSNTEFETKR
jgi:hypothetical protein